jgi:PhnB protein
MAGENSMQLSVHLSFDGHCAAAFRDYQRRLGGKLITLMSYGESPMVDKVPVEWRERIVHARLEFAGMHLTGSDVPPESYVAPQGFFVTLNVPGVERGRELFGTLAEGGVLRLPFQKTFWSPGYGLVVDRYGVPWEINCEE